MNGTRCILRAVSDEDDWNVCGLRVEVQILSERPAGFSKAGQRRLRRYQRSGCMIYETLVEQGPIR
jgi:hypothetical protein